VSTQIQYRRGTSSENDSFTGALGEVTVDTTLNSLRVHNGSTAGGSKIISVNSQTGHANITGNLLPTANVTYDLGSVTQRWRTGYFSSGTIDLGGSQISVDPATGFSFTVAGTDTPIVLSANGAATSNTFTASTVTISSSTQSTHNTNGALVVVGGLGVSQDVFFGANLTVGGNLFINGNSTIINANNLSINDSMIYLAEENPADTLDIGFTAHVVNPTLNHVGFVRDASDSVWKLFSNVATQPTTTVDFTGANYSTLLVGNLVAVGNLIVANITAGGSLGTTGQFLSQTGSGLGWVTLSANKISQNASNVTVSESYVNVAVNGSSVFSFGATQMVTTQTIIPSANNVSNIGSITNQWGTIFGKATTAQYADLAEIYTTDQQYPAGTVVVFGGEAEITQSQSSHDTRIAGVVSSNPAYLMNSTETGVPVALQGRVPCSVLGPVSKGDRVVASHIPGVAQALDPLHYQPGCIIGKALQAIDSEDISIIEVVVGRV
jgi:hypothetical protein